MHIGLSAQNATFIDAKTLI